MKPAPAALLLALFFTAPAWPTAEDDLKEMGIESKHGTGSAVEQIGKAKALDAKYERAKARVAEAFGGASEKEKEKKPSQKAGRGTVRLKNGQELTGVTLVETNEKGYWVEVDGGKLFLEKSEVAEI